MDVPPLIDSRVAFRAAVLWGLQSAIAQGARRIVCSDNDFRDWPWDDAPAIDVLTPWLRLPQRSLLLLAGDFDAMLRLHPRFTRWRADFGHALSAWRPAPDGPQTLPLPTVLVADVAVSVHLMDPLHGRGRASVEAREAQRWRESIDAVLQRSVPAWPVRTLGL